MYAYNTYRVMDMRRQEIAQWQKFLAANKSGFRPVLWEEFYQALEQRDAQLDLKAQKVSYLFAGFSGEAPKVDVFQKVILSTGDGRVKVTIKALYTVGNEEYLNGATERGEWYTHIPVKAVFKTL